MRLYALNVGFIAVWALACFSGRQKKYKRIIFLALCFTQLFLISALRFNVGNDYGMYSEAFLRIGLKTPFTMSYLDWEYGFVFYTRLVTLFTNDPIIYFAVTAFLCILPVFIFIGKNSKLPWFSTLLYVNLSFFYLSMNFLRQSMAIGISLIAWEFLKKRKLLPFVLVITIGAFFHASVLIMLPVYFVCEIKPGAKLIVLYGYLLLAFFVSSNGLINLYKTAYSFKYMDSIFVKEGISLVYSLIPVSIFFLAAIYQKRLLEYDKQNKYLINMLYISAFFMLIMARHAILERFSYYTYIYVILLLPEITLAVKSYYDNQSLSEYSAKNTRDTLFSGSTKGMAVGIAIVCVVLTATTLYNFLGMYAGKNGINGVYPFESWVYSIAG